METSEVMPQSCEEFARIRLSHRAIKDTTLNSYMTTLRVLGLSHLPYEWLTVQLVTDKLARVLNSGTRRKHQINLRASLGVHIPWGKPDNKQYQIPEHTELHDVIDASPYRMYGFSMLYAGMRIAESCMKQRQTGSSVYIDRQRRPDGVITSSKTKGPVLVPDWFAIEYADWQPELCPSSVYYGLRRSSKKLGVPLTQGMLRHAFATRLVNEGATPEMLRAQMRHHDVSMSLRYYVQTSPEDFRKVVERMGAR